MRVSQKVDLDLVEGFEMADHLVLTLEEETACSLFMSPRRQSSSS